MHERSLLVLTAVLLLASCGDDDTKTANDPTPAPAPTPAPTPGPATPATTKYEVGKFWDALRDQGHSVTYKGTRIDENGASETVETRSEFAATGTAQGQWRGQSSVRQRWIRTKTGYNGTLPDNYSFIFDLFNAADGSWHGRDLMDTSDSRITLTPDDGIPQTMQKGESAAWATTAFTSAAGVYRRSQKTLELRGSPNSADLALMCDVQDYRNLPSNLIYNWTECIEIAPDGTTTGYATNNLRVPGTSARQDTQATDFTIGGVSFTPPAGNNRFEPN